MTNEDKVRVRLYEPNRGYNCFKLNIAEPKVYVVRDYVMSVKQSIVKSINQNNIKILNYAL